ncbi:sensor histidine kinase [Mucilaginibacter lacusdianchii]|uniref:sensor histidine kinase n=1 Tax=Mucilaginibacter lacusdianchii TaxID=2684211 RepID=UPI00131DAD3A|nr:histidine kinase [Mucilaginibacter sp. JXJ CY 39]
MSRVLNTKLKGYALIEFWVMTCCIIGAYLLSLLSFVDVINGQQHLNTREIGLRSVPLLFSYLIVFIFYLSICFYLSPAFESDNEAAAKSTPIILFFMGICYLAGVINMYFAVLLALKILSLFFKRNTDNKGNNLHYEIALLVASWILLSFITTLYLPVPFLFGCYVNFDVLMGILVYLYAVNFLCPHAAVKKRPGVYYWGYMFLLAILSTIVIYLTCLCFKTNASINSKPIGALYIIMGTDENVETITILNFFTQLLIIAPLARAVYKSRTTKASEEIKTLKTELEKSDASLNFLKSQINPHFLFNALNTLYATALQEKADRTSEGIQNLGDMMRFMLEENTQDKILLERDIDYLRNYILLQKLRIENSPEIVIDVQISDYKGELMIAPMLLIPFVENAFKHGISLQNPSHIKVTLQIDQNTLYFDVHNSIHIRTENDPEKSRSGIGLENVKQRLVLLYPQKHDLVIHQNGKEFYIHLTLELADQTKN